MTPKAFSSIITADGEYVFPALSKDTKEGTLEISGGFGSGTVQPGYSDPAGDFVPLRNQDGDALEITAAGSFIFDRIPYSRQLAIKLTGATAATITVVAS